MSNKINLETEEIRDLKVLEALEQESEVKQADLAARLNLAVGTVNWLLKRLASKGYIKTSRINRWQWRYILTPHGFAEKSRLTKRYIQVSMRLYNDTRQRARELLSQIKENGYASVYIDESQDNELIDVCKLTSLEQGLDIKNTQGIPALNVSGREIYITWPDGVEYTYLEFD